MKSYEQNIGKLMAAEPRGLGYVNECNDKEKKGNSKKPTSALSIALSWPEMDTLMLQIAEAAARKARHGFSCIEDQHLHPGRASWR